MNNDSPNSSGLIIGVILGILVLGGIFLYMRGTGTAGDTSNDGKASLDVNVKMPTGGDSSGGNQAQ
ncbi:MAG: hypothetical protein RJB39_357 [Candidatus Parcubacteria bacterium]|jgi:hypothetical protein